MEEEKTSVERPSVAEVEVAEAMPPLAAVDSLQARQDLECRRTWSTSVVTRPRTSAAQHPSSSSAHAPTLVGTSAPALPSASAPTPNLESLPRFHLGP